MHGIDWNAVRAEVTAHLQALVRIDTTNPPGNETRAARYLASVLEGEGFEAEITESAPGRGNVTARWEGGAEPPLLLLGHTDVVAADAEAWTRPPFGGEIHDGCVWGRGALDMKNMVAAELMVLLLLGRQGLRLNRDVMFAATADEEAGKGNHGPGWLLDHHPAGIEAPVILTEGGGHEVRLGGRRFTTCQVGQKGICRLRATARGRPGHGSVPHGDNAVLKLAAALAPLKDHALPVHPSATLRAFFEAVSEGRPDLRADLLALFDPERSEAALARLPLDDAERAGWSALLRNTASVTMLSAGSGINIIPAEATAWIDGRLAPGQTQESFLAELRSVVGGGLEFEVDQYSPPLEAEAAGDFYDTIAAVMARHEPEAPLVPVLSTGGTDAKHIVPRRPGTRVYGFMPYRRQAGSGELGRVHGHDERTSIEELLFATRVIYEIVCAYGGIET